MNSPAGGRRLGRSILAVVAAFVAVAVLSIATDVLLHAIDVYPAWGEPMHDPGLNALALGYRMVFTVFGGWLVARLAPYQPMTHVWVLAGIGFCSAGTGWWFTRGLGLGPEWMPLILWLSAVPTTWIGGKIHGQATTVS